MKSHCQKSKFCNFVWIFVCRNKSYLIIYLLCMLKQTRIRTRLRKRMRRRKRKKRRRRMREKKRIWRSYFLVCIIDGVDVWCHAPVPQWCCVFVWFMHFVLHSYAHIQSVSTQTEGMIMNKFCSYSKNLASSLQIVYYTYWMVTFCFPNLFCAYEPIKEIYDTSYSTKKSTCIVTLSSHNYLQKWAQNEFDCVK